MRATILALLVLVVVPGASFAAPDQYISDALKRPPYEHSLGRLFKGVALLQPWSRHILRGWGHFVEAPETDATIAGRRYRLFNVCKSQDCIDNQIEILFAPGGTRAWGALIVDNKPIVYLGRPDRAQRAAMKAAIVAYDPWAK